MAEDLDVASMVGKPDDDTYKEKRKRKGLYDVAPSLFLSMLKYKCEWYGRTFRQVGRFYPSSKTCNVCGSIFEIGEAKKWGCPTCLNVHQRDENAAKNILNEGRRLVHAQPRGTSGVADCLGVSPALAGG